MSESERVQRWRAHMHDTGHEPITIWLPRDEKRRLEKLARSRRCAPSDIVQQALAMYPPDTSQAPESLTVAALAERVEALHAEMCDQFRALALRVGAVELAGIVT